MPTTTIETNAARVALEKIRPDIAPAVGLTAKDGFAIGRGDVVGVITASGLGRRRTRATVGDDPTAVDSDIFNVDDASVFAVGDVVKNSAGVTVGTIESIDLDTNVITLTGNAAVVVATGANVFGSDGSQTAKGIADEASDGVGDTPIRILIGGCLDESLCLRLDATAKTELAGSSRVGGIFKF